MDSPGTWEILWSTNLSKPMAPGFERGRVCLAVVCAARERTCRQWLERGSESISDHVFGAGSLSALIVLMTPGNAAQVDPVEGRGAPRYRIAFEKHGRCFET
jgi:hypothetical protein